MIFAPQVKLASHKSFIRYLEGRRVPIINLEVSLSSVCNAQCDSCFYKDDKNKKDKFIDSHNLILFLRDAMEDGMEAVTFSGGGEPTLHPKFPEIVKNSTKELKYGLFTNALDPIKYDAGKFDWIRVTKTNKDFNDGNIKKLSENCKSVGLCINYKDASEQIEEIEHALTLANKYDLEYVQLRPALNIMGEITYISAPAKYGILLDKKLIITDYKFQKCKDKNRGYKHCEGYHFTPMVWENGMMSACMYMRHNHDYDIGSIYDHTFTELCNMMPESLPVLDDCQICCKNNEINKFISDAKNIKNRRFV